MFVVLLNALPVSKECLSLASTFWCLGIVTLFIYFDYSHNYGELNNYTGVLRRNGPITFSMKVSLGSVVY